MRIKLRGRRDETHSRILGALRDHGSRVFFAVLRGLSAQSATLSDRRNRWSMASVAQRSSPRMARRFLQSRREQRGSAKSVSARQSLLSISNSMGSCPGYSLIGLHRFQIVIGKRRGLVMRYGCLKRLLGIAAVGLIAACGDVRRPDTTPRLSAETERRLVELCNDLGDKIDSDYGDLKLSRLDLKGAVDKLVKKEITNEAYNAWVDWADKKQKDFAFTTGRWNDIGCASFPSSRDR